MCSCASDVVSYFLSSSSSQPTPTLLSHLSAPSRTLSAPRTRKTVNSVPSHSLPRTQSARSPYRASAAPTDSWSSRQSILPTADAPA
ncbi:hypothetical protein AB1N83_006229 [Pleurotus pulmonarius]